MSAGADPPPPVGGATGSSVTGEGVGSATGGAVSATGEEVRLSVEAGAGVGVSISMGDGVVPSMLAGRHCALSGRAAGRTGHRRHTGDVCG